MDAEQTADDRQEKSGVISISLVAILLAVGLGLLYMAIRLVLGEAVAGAVVAALGIGYGALAFLTNSDPDSSRLRGALGEMFRPGLRSYAAIVLIWLAAAGVAAIPMTRGEFTISVVDEFRRPIETAEIWVDFGDGEQALVGARGVATASYFVPTAPEQVRVRVRYAGLTTSVVHAIGADGRFGPLQVAVWSGNPVLRATHLTFEGLAIHAVLAGRLPSDLARRFPNVSRVIRNEVYETTRALVNLYARFSDERVGYFERRVDSPGSAATASPRYFPEDSDDFRRVRNARNVRPIFASAAMDMSDDILGCPTVEPLRPGFRLIVNNSDNFYLGTPARPLGPASERLNARAAGARGENGAYSILVERALSRDDIATIVARPGALDESEDPREIAGLLRYLVSHQAPRGLVKGWARLSRTYDECAAVESAVALEFQIPAPKLRVTILENTTDRPVRIDRLIETVEVRSGFGRRSQTANRTERPGVAGVYYELQPGEAIILPRELTMQSMVADEDIRLADLPGPPGDIAIFELTPQEQPFGERALPTPEQDFATRPRRISIASSRLVLPAGDAGAPSRDEENSPEDIGYETMGPPAGPENLIGSSVAEIDYVIGGVRIRARSDSRTVVAMIGDTPSGSCPFVFVSYAGSPQAINRGQIITDRIGPSSAGADRMVVGTGIERIEIRELERERSFLNSARLIVRSPRGARVYRARNRLLSRHDGRHLVLNQGDAVTLDFGYRPLPGDGAATLEVSGYYVPLARDGSGGARKWWSRGGSNP